MIFVDKYTRLKVVKFLGMKKDATSAIRSFAGKVVTPEKLEVGAIRTNNGGEFEGDFHYLLDELRIPRQHTPKYTPIKQGSKTGAGATA